MSVRFLDLLFPVAGSILPTDHAYALYAGLTEVVPAFHDKDAQLRFAPISGLYAGKGLIQLSEKSRLCVRVPDDQVATVLPLAGKDFEIGKHRFSLRTPTVAQLIPAPMLIAMLVTFKNSMDPNRFLTVARERLEELGVLAEPGIPLVQQGQRAGEPRRRVIRIRGRRVVGYPLQVAGLTADESLRLQQSGLGGRRRMACGFFMPYRPRTL
jgi:CRISPR-associated protein Cas6